MDDVPDDDDDDGGGDVELPIYLAGLGILILGIDISLNPKSDDNK